MGASSVSCGGEDVEEPKSPNAEVTTKSVVDVGLIKRVKQKQNLQLSSDSDGEEIAVGVIWSSTWKSKGNRHFLA